MTENIPESFSSIIKGLFDLLEEPGITPPTSYAFTTALKLVIWAYEHMGYSFPYASQAYTDDLGGIIVTWASQQNPKRTVCLFCPSSSEELAEIYYTDNEWHTVEELLSDSTILNYWLNWSNE